MERLVEQYDRESMKMAILNHEKIFKEQVCELHRLYRIQKLLMDDMEKKGLKTSPTFPLPHEYDSVRHNTEDFTSLSLANYSNAEQQRSPLAIDLERPPEDYLSDDDGEEILQIERESDIELTLGIGLSQRRKDQTLSLASNSGLSFSSSSTDSGAVMQKNVRTQSIKTIEMLTGHNWGLIQMPSKDGSFQHEKNSFAVKEQLRRGKVDQPPWLYNVLSLNMT